MSALDKLKAKLEMLEALEPTPQLTAPIPTTNYDTVELRRYDDPDKRYSHKDDDYPFEAIDGYGQIIRQKPFPVPHADRNRLLFAEPERLETELVTAQEIMDRRYGGEASADQQLALAATLREEVASCSTRLTGLLSRARVDTSVIERQFTVPEAPDAADLMTELPVVWQREEEDAEEYRQRILNVKRFAAISRLRHKLAQLQSAGSEVAVLRRTRNRLSHDCDEALALLEFQTFVREAVEVALSEGARSHTDEAGVFNLHRAAAADETRVSNNLPLFDRHADSAIAATYNVKSIRMQETLPCDEAIEMLRSTSAVVEGTVYPHLGEAQHAWRDLMEKVTAARDAVHATNSERESRRSVAEQRYAKVRDAHGALFMQSIPMQQRLQ